MLLSQRVRRQIDALLGEAEASIRRSDWLLVRERARQVLTLDPENSDAPFYVAAAERGLQGEVTLASDAAKAVAHSAGAPAGAVKRPLGEVPTDAATAMRVLLATEVFAKVEPQLLLPVLEELTRNDWITERLVPAGTSVVREGDPGDTMYVLSEGQVQVTTSDGGSGAREVALLQPGAIFGEMALLLNRRRSATVQAVSDAALLVLPAHAWKHLSIRVSNATARLMEIVDQRQAPRAGDAG